MNYKIALLPGDGIGIEVTNAAVKVISFIAEKFNLKIEFIEYAIGGNCYDKFGTPLTCLLYTSPSPRDRTRSRMPSSA